MHFTFGVFWITAEPNILKWMREAGHRIPIEHAEYFTLINLILYVQQ